MNEFQKTKQLIQEKLDQFNRQNHNLAILLVVTLDNEPTENDYSEFSVRTMYATERELNDIIVAFKQFADYVDVAYGEKDFIQKLASGHYKKIDGYHKVVYTGTATGTARSRSALTPALCELYGLSICSNDIFTSALLDNKLATLGLLKHYGFPVPATWAYSADKGWVHSQPPPGLLLITKPAYEAASIGITDKSAGMLSPNYLEHIHHISESLRQPVLVQEIIPGYEVEAPVFDFDAPFCPGVSGLSVSGKKNLEQSILGYDTIFDDGFDLYDYSASNPQTALLIKETAANIFNRLELRGPVRMDFRVNDQGQYFIFDYNNSPHLGRKHSFAFVLETLGFEYADVLKLVVLRSLKQS